MTLTKPSSTDNAPYLLLIWLLVFASHSFLLVEEGCFTAAVDRRYIIAKAPGLHSEFARLMAFHSFSWRISGRFGHIINVGPLRKR
jgi:hypothetical protein